MGPGPGRDKSIDVDVDKDVEAEDIDVDADIDAKDIDADADVDAESTSSRHPLPQIAMPFASFGDFLTTFPELVWLNTLTFSISRRIELNGPVAKTRKLVRFTRKH